ncbi:MAG: hypothetical protein LBH76_08700 [Propionibacteriaceae bacterium]|nr:hypothetical protein [Propionibacteriaceae bacterium]
MSDNWSMWPTMVAVNRVNPRWQRLDDILAGAAEPAAALREAYRSTLAAFEGNPPPWSGGRSDEIIAHLADLPGWAYSDADAAVELIREARDRVGRVITEYVEAPHGVARGGVPI